MPRRARAQLWIEGAFWLLILGFWSVDSPLWFGLLLIRGGWLVIKFWFYSELGGGRVRAPDKQGFIAYSFNYIHDRSPFFRALTGVVAIALVALAAWQAYEDYMAPPPAADEAGALERAWDWARDKTGL